ncbi:TolC family protein [Sphingomonas sp. PP-CC-3A-396]|uniref:efflux transporter outer membrane subunit n=1 Tax=Sphingomonas sp. PP-CC-3A-396 TaxID=2135655 RepID=UPI0010451AF5|nr:TolC family protein [Sphingomonas sp. PP-CC-3A-396]TCQ06344.1 NodT family efflux transporter outer membrane factor (OMF) lipoprotein [Sphingomonas sp. PP-CC-3A-396]
MESWKLSGALSSLALVASLSSCVSADYRRPELAVPTAFTPYPAVGSNAALEQWWVLFGDEQLNSLITEALVNAPTAKTAAAVLDEARAVRDAASTQYQPQGGLSLGADARNTSVSRTADTTQGVFTGAFSPSWELGLFGRSAALRRSLDGDIDAARFAYEGTRQSLTSNVAASLFEARGVALRLVQARQTLRLSAELARVGERRVSVGIGSRADAASLQADEASAVAAVQSFEVQLEVARRTLLVLLGRGTQALEALPIAPNLGRPPPVPPATPATLLVRRPDIRQAEAQLRSAAGNLKLDALALLPSVNLSAALGLVPIIGAGGYTTRTSSFGPAIGIPLFDRRRLLAQVRGQRARTEQAVIAYENTVQTAFGEAQNTLAQYAADQRQLVSVEQAEERARFAFGAQRAGYRAGVVDLTTLLQAERIWRANLSTLSDLRATALIDAVNVFRALGGGWRASTIVANEAVPKNVNSDDSSALRTIPQ